MVIVDHAAFAALCDALDAALRATRDTQGNRLDFLGGSHAPPVESRKITNAARLALMAASGAVSVIDSWEMLFFDKGFGRALILDSALGTNCTLEAGISAAVRCGTDSASKQRAAEELRGAEGAPNIGGSESAGFEIVEIADEAVL